MLLRATSSHSCRPAAPAAACVRPHQQNRHTRSCRQSTFQHNPIVSVAYSCHGHVRKVACGSYYTAYETTYDIYGRPQEQERAPLEIHARLPLKCVALGDNNTHVISCENGSQGWSGGLSEGLRVALAASKRYGKSIATVALGRNQGSEHYRAPADPGEVWFMMRDTCTTYMGEGSELNLRQQWQDSDGDDRVEKVAFAPNCGWCIRRRDGDGEWDNLPGSLVDTLHEHWWSEGGMKQLSVGHNGEWFVLFESGAVYAQGLHPTLDRLLDGGEVGGRTLEVEWVELGPNGTFVALFDNHTVWYGSQVLTEHLLACM